MLKKLPYALFLFCLVSCSNFKKIIESPKVKLENVSINNLALSGVNLDIILEVINPNNIDFDVKNLTYSLDVNDKLVTSGKLKEKILVKAKERTLVTVPLTLQYSDILSSALMFLKKEGMPYRVKGSAEIGPFTIPFDDTGNLKSADL